MKIKYLSVLILGLISLSGCSSEPPKEGDFVTWEVTPQFIIQTELGPRRDLVQYDKDKPLYRPELERYVGVFSIDYTPKKHRKLSKNELQKINNKKSADEIEFDLALNGSNFKPNDWSLYGDKVMVSNDQVRVLVTNNSNKKRQVDTLDELKKGVYNSEISSKYNLDCYEFLKSIEIKNEVHKYKVYECLGTPIDNTQENINFNILPGDNDRVIAEYNLKNLGINVRWRTNEANLKDWQKINSSIMSLLNSWNVSSSFNN
jgi:hypothetical protein